MAIIQSYMEKNSVYLPPVAEVILMQSSESLLNLSNFGDTNTPGQSFTPGDTVIDYPVDF